MHRMSKPARQVWFKSVWQSKDPVPRQLTIGLYFHSFLDCTSRVIQSVLNLFNSSDGWMEFVEGQDSRKGSTAHFSNAGPEELLGTGKAEKYH